MKRIRKRLRSVPTPDTMGPSAQYLHTIRQQMDLLDEAPEYVAKAVHEFGLIRGLTVRSQKELDTLLAVGARPLLPNAYEFI